MDILNLGIVRKLKMPLPPIELQNSFVAFASQVDKSKVVELSAFTKWAKSYIIYMGLYVDLKGHGHVVSGHR